MKDLFRNLWTRLMLRHIHYRDRYKRFDQLYRIKNPWKMDTESEMFRFEETNRLIRLHFDPIDTLLEIGCGEGHQTVKLAEVANRVYAIDISHRAVDRARRRCPNALIDVGDTFNAPLLKSSPTFDLVVACEVLYYMRDLSKVLAQMERLGRSCFVTYVSTQQEQLASLLERIPHRQTAKFEHSDIHWYAVWWRTTESATN